MCVYIYIHHTYISFSWYLYLTNKKQKSVLLLLARQSLLVVVILVVGQCVCVKEILPGHKVGVQSIVFVFIKKKKWERKKNMFSDHSSSWYMMRTKKSFLSAMTTLFLAFRLPINTNITKNKQNNFKKTSTDHIKCQIFALHLQKR